MKNYLLILSTVLLLGLSGCKDVVITQEDTAYASFKSWITFMYDGDGDGVLSAAEVEEVREVQVENCGFTSLEGVEVLVNLEELDCRYNSILKLDLSNNKKLETVICSYTPMEELILPQGSNIHVIANPSTKIIYK